MKIYKAPLQATPPPPSPFSGRLPLILPRPIVGCPHLSAGGCMCNWICQNCSDTAKKGSIARAQEGTKSNGNIINIIDINNTNRV